MLVSGGHSPWSTIGANGFVLDLTLYKSIAVNSADRSVIVAGGVLTKELSTKLSDSGQCTGKAFKPQYCRSNANVDLK